MKIAAVRIHGSQLFLGFRMVLFDTECYPSCSFIVYCKTTYNGVLTRLRYKYVYHFTVHWSIYNTFFILLAWLLPLHVD